MITPKVITPKVSHLPEAIVKAWKEAGAGVGWMPVDKNGFFRFWGVHVPGDLPAFGFSVWKEGQLAKLPAPMTPFGLSLFHAQVTDAGLKELAGLKSLQSLILNGTQVTDAGLKELAGLKSLQTLDLGNNR